MHTLDTIILDVLTLFYYQCSDQTYQKLD